MYKLEQFIKNAREFNSVILQIKAELKNKEVFGVPLGELQKETNYKISESNRKITFNISKNNADESNLSSIEFEVYLDQNLKFERLVILKKIGFGKRNKITLLIGNGIWRSLSLKETKNDEFDLDIIFEKFIKSKDHKLGQFFKDTKFGEEEFGKLDILCEIYENRHKFDEFFKKEMEEISKEKEKLFNYVVSKIRDGCNIIKETATYSNLTNQFSDFII
jgi:hypothetical protein